MSFHDVEFPREISYGSSGGPGFSTTVLELASGHEKRNINWSEVRASYDVAHAIKTSEQFAEILDFFYARFGRAYTFRFYDWLDHATGAQTLGTGDGATVDFQLKKRYLSGSWYYDRIITKPIAGSLTNLAVGGVNLTPADYTVDYTTGIITLDTPAPLADDVTIGNCDFHVHARFDTDKIEATHEFWETLTWPSIPIVEVRNEI